MADQKITELPIKNASAIQLADYLLGIDAAEGYQMLISDLAKKIIESYSGTSLGGAGITLKAALDNIAAGMATIESSTTASKAYAIGDYLVMNGLLYKVTAAIASGGTITVGTNVTAAAAADDIAGISKEIGDTALGTTATTITGAIAEHEQDISGLNSNIKRSTLSNTTISASNLEIPIANYTQYAFFVMEISSQSWIDTYIWSTYAATKNVQFGYNHGSSARCDFSSSGFKFSNLSLASGISSFNVRVIGVKIPAD